MAIIYLDTLFLLNFLVSFVLLHITSVTIKNEVSSLRLVVGGIFCAFYSCLMFFSHFASLYLSVSKLIFSILIIIFVFKTANIKEILKSTFVFYFSSFCVAGTELALTFIPNAKNKINLLISNGAFYFNISPFSLLICFSISYIFIILFTKICAKIYRIDKLKIDIEIGINGKIIILKALKDTGNSLKEPLTNLPVIITEFNSISKIMPKEFNEFYQNEIQPTNEKLIKILYKLKDIKINLDFYLLPFSTIEKKSLTLGFKPHIFSIILKNEKISKKVIVGVTKMNIGNGCSAILNPELCIK